MRLHEVLQQLQSKVEELVDVMHALADADQPRVADHGIERAEGVDRSGEQEKERHAHQHGLRYAAYPRAVALFTASLHVRRSRRPAPYTSARSPSPPWRTPRPGRATDSDSPRARTRGRCPSRAMRAGGSRGAAARGTL